MRNTITLANGKIFQAESEQTLLEAATANGIALEYSCRTGRCGVCKTQVISGVTNIIKNEISLTDQDVKNGFILTCCRTVASDVYIDSEDLGVLGDIKVKTFPCRIDFLHKLSEDVIEVVLRTPPNSRIEYLAGQYVDMIGKDGLRRSYSIANAPREDGRISLQIRKVDNGKMSKYWFEIAKPNDLLRMEGPLGTFCLRNSNAENLILMATGTGIAPIKAILEKISESHKSNAYKNIYLYWGGRVEKDLYWRPEFKNISLKYTPVLSRVNVGEWSGRKGHIQDAVLVDGIDLEKSVVYACGSENMIQSAKQKLESAGLSAKNFYSDAFVSSS